MFRKFGSLVLLGSAFIVGSAPADILAVPAEYPTIGAAIFASSSGDQIVVSPGTYEETVSVTGASLEIVAVSGPDRTTIQAPKGAGFGVVSVNGAGSSGTRGRIRSAVSKLPLCLRQRVFMSTPSTAAGVFSEEK